MPLRPSGHSHGGSAPHSAAPGLRPSTALWLLWGRVPGHQAIQLPVRSSSSGCVISTKPFTSWNLSFSSLVCSTSTLSSQPHLPSSPALSCLFHRPKVPGLLPLVTKADQSVRRTPALAGVSVTDSVLSALQWEWQLLGQAEQGLVLCAVWLCLPALWFSHL